MKVYCRGTARIRHLDTDIVYEIESDELDWDAVGSDERQMGTEIHYEAVLDHPHLGELTWGLWEYPIGAKNYSDTNVNGHVMIEDFDFGLEHEETEPDEWLDYDVPSNPFTIFMNSYHQTIALLAEYGNDHGHDLVNRLVFSHQVTALEAYLGDTLLNAVVGNTNALQRLTDGDKDLSQEKFTLAVIQKEPGLVERKVREHLRAVLYHNLAKVDALYKVALGICILDLTTDKGTLFKAIKLRHDCVHRNGFDKDGNELALFTQLFARETADMIRSFVENIEKAVQQRRCPDAH